MATSLWFAGNAIAADLQAGFGLGESAIAFITSAVQLGFIAGTFAFAVLAISDRFSPSKVFFSCALAGSTFNLGVLISDNFNEILLYRFFTGLCLAGIYPVGMKIAADYYEKGLGKALGYLVGALVIGTALPHLLKAFTTDLPWRYVIIATSALAGMAGLLMLLLVPDGPFRKPGTGLRLKSFLNIFRIPSFRKAAFGYFGHMWELYTYWAFVPLMFGAYLKANNYLDNSIPLLSFFIIGIGGIACVIGGYVSKYTGSGKVARWAMLISGICCLLSPFFYGLSFGLFILLMLIWGMAVVADSPQFSTLVAGSAPKEVTGTALTITNSIGFALTIVSIQFCSFLLEYIPFQYIGMVLVIGPALGLLSMAGGTREKVCEI